MYNSLLVPYINGQVEGTRPLPPLRRMPYVYREVHSALYSLVDSFPEYISMRTM